MTEKKVGRPKLTDEEKTKKREEKKARLKLQLAKIAKAENSEVRKKRTRELIKIGLSVIENSELSTIIKYLDKPQYVVLGTDGKVGINGEKPKNGEKYMIFFPPNLNK
jgi:hypothetical protein